VHSPCNARIFARRLLKFEIYLLISDAYGGRTRARTWDPLIKSQIAFVINQWLSCKLNTFHAIRRQRVTSEMQTCCKVAAFTNRARVLVTAYHSFGGEVEASNTPTIRRLTPLCRHQLLRIARLTLPPETIPSCYRRTRHTEFQPHSGRHHGCGRSLLDELGVQWVRRYRPTDA
jgi:hypothetical protein